AVITFDASTGRVAYSSATAVAIASARIDTTSAYADPVRMTIRIRIATILRFLTKTRIFLADLIAWTPHTLDGTRIGTGVVYTHPVRIAFG
ncbi:MAG: hypothetical protein VYB98_06535, partial [Actinomycetota bacterium]|nr:hypothetical protein [Actinomycetota bacterium]